MKPNHVTEAHAAGLLLLMGTMLLTIGFALHPVEEKHAAGEAGADASMDRVLKDEGRWRVSHWFISLGAGIDAAAALLLLSAPFVRTSSWMGSIGWALLAIFNLGLLSAGAIEATAAADAAYQRDTAAFANWSGLARAGFSMGVFVSIGWVAIILGEARAANPIVPRWASYAGVAAAGASAAFFLGATWLNIAALAPLAFAVPATQVWFLWWGTRLTWVPVEHAPTPESVPADA